MYPGNDDGRGASPRAAAAYQMKKPKIALDADGVLLDYGLAYADAWQRAFSVYPAEHDPLAYWLMDRWAVEKLTGRRLSMLRACFDDRFWSSVPAIAGAQESCERLCDAGYELVCVSAIEPSFERARIRNLRSLGFPIERVVATPVEATSGNPKAAALAELQPVAFVDDFLPYMLGLPYAIHAALLRSQATGSPNEGPELIRVHSMHDATWPASRTGG